MHPALDEEEKQPQRLAKSRTRQLLAGLAVIAACVGAVILIASMHTGEHDSHAVTSFYAGDWTPSPTARNLLGTGCTCNVQITGGFNGSQGPPGRFETGDELASPRITGDVTGDAAYSNIALRNAQVETGLRFKALSGDKRVTLAPPDTVTGADYTIKLPPSAGAPGSLLQMDTGGINTKWSNTLASPEVTGSIGIKSNSESIAPTITISSSGISFGDMSGLDPSNRAKREINYYRSEKVVLKREDNNGDCVEMVIMRIGYHVTAQIRTICTVQMTAAAELRFTGLPAIYWPKDLEVQFPIMLNLGGAGNLGLLVVRPSGFVAVVMLVLNAQSRLAPEWIPKDVSVWFPATGLSWTTIF